MKKLKKAVCIISAVALTSASSLTFFGCSGGSDEVILRVCNWEEYIDLGDRDEEELIEVYDDELCPDGILGENSMVDDFTEWFNSSDFGFNVKVEYSTFGTNEDLYNRLSLGDNYDLVCPSDYMIMKLVAENKVQAFSEEFLNAENPENYYANYVSPYINGIFTEYNWDKLAACYMWGTTGIVYNPEKINEVEDVSTWSILTNPDYKRQVTVKDNVRDAYFVALGMLKDEQLTSLTTSDEDSELRSELLNDTDSETIAAAQEILKAVKENVYSFETDSGKADMVTGKVIANYQWSGDAVYIMDEADGDENNPVELWYSVPDECTNLWFDGWIMLKDGVNGNDKKQIAAEAFINYLSRPDNAIRNMYYIGYTSSIAGDLIYDYMDWNYGAVAEDGVDIYEYDLSYFFGEGYTLDVDAATLEIGDNGEINRGRQLFAQYPTENIISRSTVMLDFGEKLSDINQMWINVRCLDVKDISPATVGIICGVVGIVALAICLYAFRYRLFINYKPKKGYTKVEN